MASCSSTVPESLVNSEQYACNSFPSRTPSAIREGNCRAITSLEQKNTDSFGNATGEFDGVYGHNRGVRLSMAVPTRSSSSIQRSSIEHGFLKALRASDFDWANIRDSKSNSTTRAKDGLGNCRTALRGFLRRVVFKSEIRFIEQCSS